MLTTSKSFETLMSNSEHVAGWSNANRETYVSLYWYNVDLYRHRDGKYFLRETGGPAMRISGEVRWISLETARDFIRDHCHDNVTGFAYTDDEVDTLMAGGRVRAETRSSDEISRPEFHSF